MKNLIQVINIVAAGALVFFAGWFALEAVQYHAWGFVALGAFGILSGGKYLESRVN